MVKRTVPCSIYSVENVTNRWSLVQGKTLIRETMCAFWGTPKQFWETDLAVRTDTNSYEVNTAEEVNIWNIITIKWQDYKVDWVIPHENIRWYVDNYQIFVTIIVWENSNLT